jgi:hypothetical protein
MTLMGDTQCLHAVNCGDDFLRRTSEKGRNQRALTWWTRYRLKNNGSSSLFPGFGLSSPIVSWGPGCIAGRGGCQFAFCSKRVGTRSGSRSAASLF